MYKEASLLMSLRHPNLVRFCGVCLEPPIVIMEYYRSVWWAALTAHQDHGDSAEGAARLSVCLINCPRL